MTLFKRTQKNIHSILIGSAVTLLLLSGVMSYINTHRLISDSQWVAHTHQVEAELQGIHASLNKIVLDLRGFLLTGDERFNTYAEKSSNALLTHFRIVRELTQDNPVQQNRLQKLKYLLDSRITMVRVRINLRKQKGINAAVSVVNQNSGDTLDQQIRSLVNEMEEMEKTLLMDRQRRVKDSNNSSFIALTLSGTLGLGLIVLVLSGLKRQITERSKAEEEKSVAAVAFDTHDAIMITDSSSKIIRVNPAFYRITGYKEADVIGHNPRILNSGRHDKAFYQQMWQELLNNGMWSGEVWDRHKSGRIYPKQLTISAVKNRAGITTKYVAIFNDISERKKTEEEIHQLAFYDALTELPNRRLLLDRLDFALSTSERTQRLWTESP